MPVNQKIRPNPFKYLPRPQNDLTIENRRKPFTSIPLRVVLHVRDIIEVRGFPNGIFNPWARWISGLALAKNSSAVAAVVVVAHNYTENTKT